MATDESRQPSAQPQQPPDCEECGTRKQHESRELRNTEGKQESEETGSQWMNSASVKVQGIFGADVERAVDQKDIETTNENESEKAQRDFNVCPNIHCEQHIKDNWSVEVWKMKENSEPELSNEEKEEKYKKMKTEILVARKIENKEYDIDIDLSDSESSEQTSEQSEDTNTTDTSSSSSPDKNESTDEQTNEATRFGDRARQWWAGNRVRQWAAGHSDDTHSATDGSTNTATTADATNTQSNQSTETEKTNKQQTSLWEYSSETQTELSGGNVGEQARIDHTDANADMGSSMDESEDVNSGSSV